MPAAMVPRDRPGCSGAPRSFCGPTVCLPARRFRDTGQSGGESRSSRRAPARRARLSWPWGRQADEPDEVRQRRWKAALGISGGGRHFSLPPATAPSTPTRPARCSSTSAARLHPRRSQRLQPLRAGIGNRCGRSPGRPLGRHMGAGGARRPSGQRHIVAQPVPAPARGFHDPRAFPELDMQPSPAGARVAGIAGRRPNHPNSAMMSGIVFSPACGGRMGHGSVRLCA